MLEALRQAPSLTAFISSRQRITLGALSEAVLHPAAPLLQEYLEQVIPVHTGPAWLQRSLKRDIVKRTHASSYTPQMKAYISGELHQHVRDGFSMSNCTKDRKSVV